MNCNSCTSESCFLYKNCSKESAQNTTTQKSCVDYPERQQIIREGSLVTGVYFVHSGTVKVFKEGLNGKEQIIRIAKSGDILGHRGIRENMVYPVSATTLERSKICFVQYDVFHSLLKENPKFSINLLHLYAAELSELEIRLRNMAQMTVRERIAESLLWIFKGVSTDDFGALNIVFSRQEIADMAGTNADQVSRELSSFVEDKILKLEGRKIIIHDLTKLRAVTIKYDNRYV